MLQFQPPGFEQRAIATTLGVMACYRNTGSLWNPPPSASALVFLHSLGGGSSAFEWSKFYPALASRYSIYAPDLIGWGQSTHLQRDYQPEDYLLQLTELLESVEAGPPTVFASSLTGGLTVRLAIRRPGLFRRLILVCPSGFSDFGESYAQNLAAQVARTPGLNQAIYALGAANELAIRNFMERFLFACPERITPEMVQAYLASAQQPNAEFSALASLRGDLCFDLALYLPQLTVPTVLAWGDRAWFSTLQRGQRLAALNPKAIQRFCTIPQAGVLPHLETPEQVLAAVYPHL